MKSFFDFIGRTENEKRRRLPNSDKRCPPKTPRPVAGGSSTSCASECLTVKSFFNFIGRTEATRGARRWSWIKKTN
ncbi:hypothetical protein [Bacillus sp. ISL-55]|uniref:hypothetical protein n=1 Tax=Bacillus sp. ISL-55 TaxID=2819134 RepID=UPI001BE78295|nr:hypothetical protein [Bacillus sp. ISL-55]MBT2695212.1 hypothetical protein [Bacillus sp. ISL-55]